MKKWKCNNCKREKSTEDNIIILLCSCGEYFIQLKGGKKR